MKVVKKKWGNERIYKNDENYCVKLLTVDQGKSCSIHHHQKKEESFLACQGKVLLEVWEELPKVATLEELEDIARTAPAHRYILEPYNPHKLENSTVVTIKPRTPHRFTGLMDIDNTFYEASTKDSADDSYRSIESMDLY